MNPPLIQRAADCAKLVLSIGEFTLVSRQSEFRTWHIPGLTPEVVYSAVVMRMLAALAEDGYGKSPMGGEEVGGVLFGGMEKGEVRVTAARALASEHARGPGFSLSAADEQQLREMLAGAATDPDLRDLVAVGWFRSRTRSGIGLSEDDIKLFNQFFPLAGQLALVLRPEAGQPTRAGFFFRPARGPMRTDASYLEFETGNGEAAASEQPDPEQPDEAPRPPAAMLSPAVRRMPRARLMAWGVVGGIAAIAAALFGFVWGRSNAVAAHLPRLSLRLVQTEGRLNAVWNGSAPPVAQALAGILEVRDGAASSSIPLNATMLRSGSWPVATQSADVSVRLLVEVPGAGPASEIAKFLGREQPASEALTAAVVPALTPQQEREAAALQREIETNRSVLAEAKRRNDDLEAKVDSLRLQVSQKFAAPKPAPGRAAEAPRPQPVSSPSAASPPVTVPVAAPPVASGPIGSAPPGQADETATAPPLFGERPTPTAKPTPATPPPSTEPARPSYGGPSAGKAIWTGSLGPGATLTLEGRRASAGSLNSALPAASLRVTVFPAEFSSGGLSVYSGQQRHAAGNTVEPRSAQNGWLETRYVYNPDRARAVSLVEGPSAANGYKLALRAGERPVSVIVIDWQIAQ